MLAPPKFGCFCSTQLAPSGEEDLPEYLGLKLATKQSSRPYQGRELYVYLGDVSFAVYPQSAE